MWVLQGSHRGMMMLVVRHSLGLDYGAHIAKWDQRMRLVVIQLQVRHALRGVVVIALMNRGWRLHLETLVHGGVSGIQGSEHIIHHRVRVW